MNAQDRRQRVSPRRREDAAAEVLGSLFRAAPIALMGVTPDGRILTWNPACQRLLGYSPAEAIDRPCSMLVPPDRIEEARDLRTRVGVGQRVAGLETVRRRKDGTSVEVALDIVPVKGAGETDLLCVIYRALAEHDPLRVPPAGTKQHLLQALSASGAGAFRFDLDNDACDYDATFARLWELPVEPLTDMRGVLARVYPEDLRLIHAALERASHEGTEFEIEHRLRLPAEPTRWLLSKGKSYVDADGRLRAMTGVSVEITRRRRAEEALRQSEERFRGMAEAIPSIVWEVDNEGRTLYANRMWFEYTGQGAGRESPEDWLQFYHPDDRHALQPARPEQGRPIDVEARIRRYDGVYRWFRVRGAPIRDSTGAIVRWVGTCTDVDDQKRAAQALEEADRHKNEFLAMLAHELRNPLASIRNAGEIVRMSESENERLRYAVDVIGRQTDRLGRLIADLLDMSNISRGKLALQRGLCDLVTVIGEAIDMNREAIERKGQTLELRLTEARLVLLGDASRLVQLVSNLLDNAMKYTPQGGRIEVAARREGERAVLDVRDTGTGIPPGLLPHVFDLFVQGERRPGHADGGLGIGLALVKEIAAMHGGSVTARSHGLGRGSEFTVSLPLTDADGAERSADAAGDGAPGAGARRILIVDDNRDYADSLAMLLQHLGHQTLALYSSVDALARAHAFAPDIALLDIGLPDMDGGELCRRLRRDSRLAGVIYVAISGFGQEADLARTRDAGFDHHLLKPVGLEDLLAIVHAADRAGTGPANA